MSRLLLLRSLCLTPLRASTQSVGGDTCRLYSRTAAPLASTRCLSLPMKPGTPIPGLDIYKEKEAPVALERHEYPDWLDGLAQPLPSLAALRRMPEGEATDKDKMRYLKLTRRVEIKKNNEAMVGQKR